MGLNLDETRSLLGQHEITFRGQTYKAEGLSVPQTLHVNALLDQEARGEETIREFYEIAMRQIRLHHPDVEDLDFSPEETGMIVGYLAGGTGEEDLQDLLAEQIAGPEGAGAPADDGAPLASARP